MRFLIAALALGVALPAAAQGSEVQRYLTAASRLYENLEYERALEQLKRARSKSTGVEDDVAVALYEGLILADMGKKEESVAAFKEGLFLKPDAKLPVTVSPKVEQEFEKIRGEVMKEMKPILEKQEAERKRRELDRLEAERKAKEDERKAKDDERRRVQERADAERRARDEEDARRKAAAAKDTPVKDTTIVATTDVGPRDTPGATDVRAQPAGKGVPTAPILLGILTAAAGGTGAYFGIQSRNSLTEADRGVWHDDTYGSWKRASDSALIANLAFGAAVLGLAGTVISIVMSSGGEPAAAADSGTGTGGP